MLTGHAQRSPCLRLPHGNPYDAIALSTALSQSAPSPGSSSIQPLVPPTRQCTTGTWRLGTSRRLSPPQVRSTAQGAKSGRRTLRLRGRFGMLGRVVSAQDEFRGFLRDVASPAMRRAGLKGSAGRYHMPSPSRFALVGFQKSKWSTSSAVPVHREPEGGELRGMDARPDGQDLASENARPKHPLPGSGMVGAHRQSHARQARSLVVAAVGPATGAGVSRGDRCADGLWPASPPPRCPAGVMRAPLVPGA
jgi:hypothetical protein